MISLIGLTPHVAVTTHPRELQQSPHQSLETNEKMPRLKREMQDEQQRDKHVEIDNHCSVYFVLSITKVTPINIRS